MWAGATEEEPSASPAVGAVATGDPTGALRPAPTTVAEGPAVEGPVVEEGLAAVMSAVRDPAAAKKGPAAGGEGPWCTRGLKVWAPLVFAISELEQERLEKKS